MLSHFLLHLSARKSDRTGLARPHRRCSPEVVAHGAGSEWVRWAGKPWGTRPGEFIRSILFGGRIGSPLMDSLGGHGGMEVRVMRKRSLKVISEAMSDERPEEEC